MINIMDGIMIVSLFAIQIIVYCALLSGVFLIGGGALYAIANALGWLESMPVIIDVCIRNCK